MFIYILLDIIYRLDWNLHCHPEILSFNSESTLR